MTVALRTTVDKCAQINAQYGAIPVATRNLFGWLDILSYFKGGSTVSPKCNLPFLISGFLCHALDQLESPYPCFIVGDRERR